MIALLFVSFFILLFIGVPIAFVLILSTVSYAFATGTVAWDLIPQRTIYGIRDFVMICLPFFMLAGDIMSAGGITERLIKCAKAFVGHIRGGLAMVDVLVCMMFGTVSGSAVTGASAVGSLMIPSMKKEGYDAGFASGLTAVATTCCPVIPPSLAFVLYGAAAKVSVGDMFIAGIIPGILMGSIMLVLVYVISRRKHYPVDEHKTPWRERLREVLKTLPCMGIPIVVVGGIMRGWFTPTEAAAIALLYALILAGLVYRTLTWKILWKSLINSAINSGAIMLIVGGCYLFGWVIANEQLAVNLANALVAMNVDVWVKLLLINGVLLIVGMFMDSSPAILLVAPILAPAMSAIGVDPIHAGMIICINLVIGLATPPVGVCLYATTGIAKCSFAQTCKSAMPFLAAVLAALLLITYVPILTELPLILFGRV